MTLAELSQSAAAQFATIYGRPPRWISAAPGRVNVIGEHTDYNDGFVLPMAIERYTVIAADAALGTAQRVQLCSTGAHGEPAIIDLTKPLQPFPKGTWANYPAGVLAGFQAKGISTGGFDALIQSTVPTGGGLSSSAALEVAMATLLEAMTGRTLDPVEKALLCQQAEHQYAGVPCGIMDQFISVMGRKDNLLLLDCRSRRTELVPMSDPSVSLLVTNTNVRHELGSGQYATRRAQCEAAAKTVGVTSLRDATAPMLEQAKSRMEDVVFRRARHVIGEIGRTTQAAREIRASNWMTVGELMYASHDSLRGDYEVSCAELEAVVEIARSIGPNGGMYGCRMTGGGFGGCTVALLKTAAVDSVMKTIATDYQRKTGIEASLFVSRPAAGATVLKP
ncbi:MAG: galactokinase [Verrucomicrobiota bacterium]|jgi:galactokinase